jgi:uncharacterized glyoxalase superfamily protein PhnB
VKQLTPILLVEEIEPCLPFWVDRMGFTKVAEMPDGDRLGFVILVRDGVQIMYQTRSLMAADIPALANGSIPGSTILYIDVSNIEETSERLEGADVIVPLRQTTYGRAEIFVREPAGNVVAFTAEVGY